MRSVNYVTDFSNILIYLTFKTRLEVLMFLPSLCSMGL